MSSRPKVKVGDVVSVPISEKETAFIQVLVKRSILYVAAFSKLYTSPPDLDEVTRDKFILSGWTMDAKIYHGKWKIIGNSPPRDWEMLKKEYTVGFEGETWVQSFDGELERVATKGDIERLFPKSSYSPAMLEDAIRAFHRIEPWCSDFDDLVVQP